MCGFAAMFEAGRSFDRELLDGIDSDLFHRGPDAAGRLSEPGIALVFRRLSIVDPIPRSDQPMRDVENRCALVFNGEIYNFRRIRRDLEAMGEVFKTNGDTEVLLRALIVWGEQALQRLEGMYAFVFVDLQAGSVLAARDPLGIKPLYFARKGKLLVFASEMRPITRLISAEPDLEALPELLVFRFAADPKSNLTNIERIPGGHLVRLDIADGVASQHRFCDPLAELHKPDDTISRDAAVTLASDALTRSVVDHLQSDVGFCVQLSGGIDSSLVAALSSIHLGKPVRSFGIDLSPAPNDEGVWRRLVVDRYSLEHHEVRLNGHDYADALPLAIQHMEGPVAHSGCVLLMLLCRHIAKHNKVVLTGEGADEFFGGYMRYRQWRELRRKGLIGSLVPSVAWPVLERWREYRRFAGRDAATYSTVQGDYLATAEIFPDFIPTRGRRESVADQFPDFRSRLFAVDQSTYLGSLLLRQDKMAMASSLEARVPFAHMPLARVLNRLPNNIRVPGGDTKPVLKSIARRYLPDALIDRRKIGLTTPGREWLSDEKGLGRYLMLLTDTDSRLAAFGDRKRLVRAVEAFRRGDWLGLPPLEHLIGMELWLRSLEPLRRRVLTEQR
jgi:asparagine synthase (glutamine-hydrolysing)